jgi:hypothetical protein
MPQEKEVQTDRVQDVRPVVLVGRESEIFQLFRVNVKSFLILNKRHFRRYCTGVCSFIVEITTSIFPCNSYIFVLEVSPAPSPCCFNSLFTWIVRVDVKIPQDGNRTNRYGCVAVVHVHCLTHGLQCLCDGRACCPPLFMQLVICRSGGFTGTVTLLFQLVVSLGLVRVGVKIPQDGNRTNRYGCVAVVHGHVWRTVCSVCATGARVAHPCLCNS